MLGMNFSKNYDSRTSKKIKILRSARNEPEKGSKNMIYEKLLCTVVFRFKSKASGRAKVLLKSKILLMSLVSHRFGRVEFRIQNSEFRIFVLIFSSAPACRNSNKY